MSQKEDRGDLALSRIAGLGGLQAATVAGTAKLAEHSVSSTNARINPVASKATQRIADANKTIEELGKKYGNRAIPSKNPDAKILKDAIAARDANVARVKGLSNLRPELSEYGKALVKERGGNTFNAATKLARGAAGKMDTITGKMLGKATGGRLGVGTAGALRGLGTFALANWAMQKGLTTSETERLQKLMNGLKYGHAVSNEALAKMPSVKETGLIGESGLSEEEVADYFHKNKGIWDSQMGGWYNTIKNAGQGIAGLFSPAGALASSGLQMKLEEGANDDWFKAMAGSLESQGKTRMWRNEQDKALGEDFARGLYGEHRALQNMQDIGGNASGPKVIPYNQNADAERQKAIAYGLNSDKVGSASAMVGANAAREGGQRWYSDVQEQASKLSNPDDQRKLRLGMMYQQGLISQDDYMQQAHGMTAQQYLQQGSTPATQATPATTKQPTVQQGVAQNASGPTTEVNPNLIRMPNQPSASGQAGMEEAMRMRAIASGQHNVEGAIGQSQLAYMRAQQEKWGNSPSFTPSADYEGNINKMGNEMWNKVYGNKEQQAAPLSQGTQAFKDALDRMRGNVLQGSGLVEFQGKNGPQMYQANDPRFKEMAYQKSNIPNGVVSNAASPTAEVKPQPMFGALPAGADPNNRFANPAYNSAVFGSLKARSDAEHTGMTTEQYVQQGIDMENVPRQNMPAQVTGFNLDPRQYMQNMPAPAAKQPMVQPSEYGDGSLDEYGIWHDSEHAKTINMIQGNIDRIRSNGGSVAPMNRPNDYNGPKVNAYPNFGWDVQRANEDAQVRSEKLRKDNNVPFYGRSY